MGSAIETNPTPQAFGSSGGKFHLAKKISSLMPEHTTYVEPYAGGAAVYFYKEPAEKEVLNDMDKEIAFAYRFIRDMTPEQYEALKRKNWVISRRQFDKLKKMKPESDLDRFHKFYYLKKGSYRHLMGQVDPSRLGRSIGIGRLPRARDRLGGVAVTSQDAMRMIDKYDSENSFFYLDPPYPGTARIGGEGPEFSKEDLEALLARLRHVKGKFILSMDSDNGRRFPKWVRTRRVRTMACPPGGGWATRTEVLGANFKMQPRKKALRRNGKNRSKHREVNKVAKVLA